MAYCLARQVAARRTGSRCQALVKASTSFWWQIISTHPHLHADASDDLDGDVVAYGRDLLEQDDSIVALCTCTMTNVSITHLHTYQEVLYS